MSPPLPRQEVWASLELLPIPGFGRWYAPLRSWGSFGQHTPMRFYLLNKNILTGEGGQQRVLLRVGWPETAAWPWSAPSGSTLTWKDWLHLYDHLYREPHSFPREDLGNIGHIEKLEFHIYDTSDRRVRVLQHNPNSNESWCQIRRLSKSIRRWHSIIVMKL